MKRIVSLVLALSMVLSMFSFAFAGTTLADVEGTDYEAAVSALVELGIVNGYEDGTYKADRTVTRAEMAKFLVVSAGLEGAADVAKGATNYSDVPASHWATGYINVASQYGYINGYPEGTFAPDATVSYAEAVTMAIRVLGYKTVVEAKGTWPTNYIAKATELKVLKDVSYGKYTDGATRGNVALLMWNMLTTNMWDVISENENNGLSYGNEGVKMINKYFADYTYLGEEYELVVTTITVNDGKVSVTLDTDKTLPTDLGFSLSNLELASGIDFLNLTGRTVSVLYNKDDAKLVMVTPSNTDKVEEGYLNELSGDTCIFSGDPAKTYGMAASTAADDYVVAVLGKGKNVETTTRYSLTAATIVEEVKVKNDVVKVNGVTMPEDAIVLIDGEWAKVEDIKVGDVVTELLEDQLYIVSRDVVTGDFEAVTDERDAEETRYFVTVDGKEYNAVAGLTAVELDEEGEEISGSEVYLAEIIEAEEDDENGKYYGEEVTLYLNFLGEIERITFGEVEDNETTGAFYVLTNAPKASWVVSDKNGETTYVELNGENYEVKAGVVVPTTNVSGDVVYVELDSKDRVKAMYLLPESGDAISGDYIVDEATKVGGIYNEDTKEISGDTTIKFRVNSNTTVVKVTPVVTKEDRVETVEYYEVATSKGAADLEGVEYAVVVSESGDSFNKAAYVFVWEDARNTEKTYGIVEKYTKSNGVEYLTIDGTKYAVEENDDLVAVASQVGRAIEFISNEDGITITNSYGTDINASGDFVAEVEDARTFILSGDRTTVIDLDTIENLEKADVFFATVSEGDEGYEFDSFEAIDSADIKVKKEDVVVCLDASGNEDSIANANKDYTILVIRGYEA